MGPESACGPSMYVQGSTYLVGGLAYPAISFLFLPTSVRDSLSYRLKASITNDNRAFLSFWEAAFVSQSTRETSMSALVVFLQTILVTPSHTDLKRPKMWPKCEIRHVQNMNFYFLSAFQKTKASGHSAFCPTPVGILCTRLQSRMFFSSLPCRICRFKLR